MRLLRLWWEHQLLQADDRPYWGRRNSDCDCMQSLQIAVVARTASWDLRPSSWLTPNARMTAFGSYSVPRSFIQVHGDGDDRCYISQKVARRIMTMITTGARRVLIPQGRPMSKDVDGRCGVRSTHEEAVCNQRSDVEDVLTVLSVTRTRSLGARFLDNNVRHLRTMTWRTTSEMNPERS